MQKLKTHSEMLINNDNTFIDLLIDASAFIVKTEQL